MLAMMTGNIVKRPVFVAPGLLKMFIQKIETYILTASWSFVSAIRTLVKTVTIKIRFRHAN